MGWSWNFLFFIFFTIGWVGFKLWDLQIFLTRPDTLIFNIFLKLKNILKKIYYIILLFTFLPLFRNKTQTLSFSHIVSVCLVLCSWLFGYKFALICGDIVLMLNLIIIIIIIIIIIKKKNYPTRFTWIGLDYVELLWWVGLGWIFLTYNGVLGWKKLLNLTHTHP